MECSAVSWHHDWVYCWHCGEGTAARTAPLRCCRFLPLLRKEFSGTLACRSSHCMVLTVHETSRCWRIPLFPLDFQRGYGVDCVNTGSVHVHRGYVLDTSFLLAVAGLLGPCLLIFGVFQPSAFLLFASIGVLPVLILVLCAFHEVDSYHFHVCTFTWIIICFGSTTSDVPARSLLAPVK